MYLMDIYYVYLILKRLEHLLKPVVDTVAGPINFQRSKKCSQPSQGII